MSPLALKDQIITMSQISIPISFGELIDKITILEIKSERVHDEDKLKNINYELRLLMDTWNASAKSSVDFQDLRAQLKVVNETLWDIEDKIRLKEAHRKFDEDFVALARAVCINNDKRASLKRKINLQLGSAIIEEKSYSDYNETNS